jgi:hypothetical protein
LFKHIADETLHWLLTDKHNDQEIEEFLLLVSCYQPKLASSMCHNILSYLQLTNKEKAFEKVQTYLVFSFAYDLLTAKSNDVIQKWRQVKDPWGNKIVWDEKEQRIYTKTSDVKEKISKKQIDFPLVLLHSYEYLLGANSFAPINAPPAKFFPPVKQTKRKNSRFENYQICFDKIRNFCNFCHQRNVFHQNLQQKEP